MMNHLRLKTQGLLAATLGLVASCGGDVRNLGNDRAPATGGSSVATGGSSVATGGSSVATGGSSVATGGSGIGEIGIGGLTGTGGQTSAVPYISDPTLPIDPTCTCDSSDKICNAARECVPRCDDAGRCARWLANHPVVDLLAEGTSLYYLVAATTDPLGNPGANGTLYRVETSAGTPTLIAGSLQNPYKILGRYKNATIVQDTEGAITTIDDAGEVSTLGPCGPNAAMWGHWIVFTNANDTTLTGIDLEGNLQPVLLTDVSTVDDSIQISAPIVLEGSISYRITKATTYVQEACSIQLSNLAAGPTCAESPDRCESAVVATAGNQFFCSFFHGDVSSYAPSNTRLLTLYNNGGGQPLYNAGKTIYANGWLYLVTYSVSDFTARLVRVPTSVGRPPQQVIPQELVTRGNAPTGGGISSDMVFGAGTSDLFWVQNIDYSNANQAQYIFSAPLPPQPCDADLPCADSTLLCNGGFCGPA